MENNQDVASWPTRLDATGRLVIPADARQSQGWTQGEELVLAKNDDGTLRILTLRQFLSEVQSYFHAKTGHRNLVDELLEERRMEAEREESSS